MRSTVKFKGRPSTPSWFAIRADARGRTARANEQEGVYEETKHTGDRGKTRVESQTLRNFLMWHLLGLFSAQKGMEGNNDQNAHHTFLLK